MNPPLRPKISDEMVPTKPWVNELSASAAFFSITVPNSRVFDRLAAVFTVPKSGRLAPPPFILRLDFWRCMRRAQELASVADVSVGPLISFLLFISCEVDASELVSDTLDRAVSLEANPLLSTARIISLSMMTSSLSLFLSVSPDKCLKLVSCVIGLSLRRYIEVLCRAKGLTVVGGAMILSTPILSTFSRILIPLSCFFSSRDRAILLRVMARDGRSTGVPINLRLSRSAPDASRPVNPSWSGAGDRGGDPSDQTKNKVK